ncbi:MAG: hypothetical protein AMK69_11030 [Nitrospira bacterium SG8_3]|nr:MAG: hypothetical protein AMK69_11030 [Nitrospira bacterium SG8_3]
MEFKHKFKLDLEHHIKEISSLFPFFRESLGLTQDEAAKLLGITRVTLSRWETGLIPDNMARLRAVEDFLIQNFPSSAKS